MLLLYLDLPHSTNVCLDCLRRHRNHRGHSAMEENVKDEGVEYDSVNPDGTLRQIDIDKCCSLVSVG